MLKYRKNKAAVLLASIVGVSTFVVPSVAAASSQIDDYAAESRSSGYAVFSESNVEVPILNIKSGNIEGEVYTNYSVQTDSVSHMLNFSESFMSFDHTTCTKEYNSKVQGLELDLNLFGINEVEVECSKLDIDEVLGANESVNVVCDSLNGVVNSDTVIFSSNGDIIITADTIDFNGVIYAPNGKVVLNADRINVNGSIIGNVVEINADSCTIQSDEELIDNFGIDTYCVSELSSLEKVSDYSDENAMIKSSSGDGNYYYYNTGTDVVSQATYSKYDLLKVVKAGDIIHENRKAEVTPGTFLGHIAYVEGVYYLPLYGSGSSSSTYKYNIRVIEAIGKGVCRGILDDKRCDDNRVKLLRYGYNGLPSRTIATITSFITRQIGKDYGLETEYMRDSSVDSPTWYCSRLVWAGYLHAGYDIEDGNELYITPGDILDSPNIKTISYK